MPRPAAHAVLAALLAVSFPPVAGRAEATPTPQAAAGPSQATMADATAQGLEAWLDEVDAALVAVEAALGRGDVAEARSIALKAYLDRFERIEGYYGQGGAYGGGELPTLIAAAESRFHELLRGDASGLSAVVAALREDIARIRDAARAAGVPLVPGPADAGAVARSTAASSAVQPRTPEIAAIVEELRTAERLYGAGDAEAAQQRVDHAYLEGFELLEARLPSAVVGRIERLIHLSLRPQIQQRAPVEPVEATFAALYAELGEADAALGSGGSFWFGAVNAFIIIVREGLEAVLLIAALIAYLGATGASRRHHRQIYTGAGLGVVASFGTWIVARTLIPIGGANRELIEGITALIAVGVLLYVAHWLFHKTYVHDWKEYLRGKLDKAVSTGSALAMAGLAFAAIYREGFETVLFYEALRYDVGSTAVLAGFAPGMILILGVGVAIIRLGLKLPLRQVFSVTNTILLYLAFVFLGKGIYNLQEAGLFAPHPVAWAPDHEALRLALGFYPIAETMLAQAGFLALILATYALYRRSMAKAREARVAAASTARAGA